jgi:hypothetical protein
MASWSLSLAAKRIVQSLDIVIGLLIFIYIIWKAT